MKSSPVFKLLSKLRESAGPFRRMAMAALPALSVLLLLVLAVKGFLFQRDDTAVISYKINQLEDVISSNSGGISNLDKLDQFLERESGSQRVVHYTIEGDPIFTELRYNNSRLEVSYDTTEDAFGSGIVDTYACSGLVRTEKDHLLKYILKGCGEENLDRDVLAIDFNVERQDRFEFVLKYGVNRRNEMNTVNQSLVKDMRNGTVIEVSDYGLPQADRQSIYRKLVLANYLEKKQLSTSCNRKPYESYELTVMINAAERHYAWSECDNSSDGRTMSGVADYIIGLVEADERYKQLPEATGYYQ